MGSEERALRPGQLWTWDFGVGDGSWVLRIVTSEARADWFKGIESLRIIRGDMIMLVSTDDPGPQELLEDQRTWATALFGSTLVWIDRSWFTAPESILRLEADVV